MKSFFIRKQFGTLHYLQLGEGKETVFFFSGFGMSAKSVSEMLLGEDLSRFTFYIIDVFGEGRSTDFKGELTNQLWLSYLDEIFKTHNITEYQVLACSIGVRLAIPLIHFKKANKITFITPDAIAPHPVYSVLIRYEILRKIILATARGLCPFLFFLSKRKKKFFHPSVLQKVFKQWLLLDGLSNVAQWDVPTKVFLARHDYIIRNYAVAKWKKKLSQSELEYLSCGHFDAFGLWVKQGRLF